MREVVLRIIESPKFEQIYAEFQQKDINAKKDAIEN
jgi:hypothetical protein